jgi:hypothetical protein
LPEAVSPENPIPVESRPLIEAQAEPSGARAGAAAWAWPSPAKPLLDFFTVATVRFHVLFVLLILAHDRRSVVHFHITKDPTAR